MLQAALLAENGHVNFKQNPTEYHCVKYDLKEDKSAKITYAAYERGEGEDALRSAVVCLDASALGESSYAGAGVCAYARSLHYSKADLISDPIISATYP